MELPNIHFQDYPIEFKEINPEDFPHFEVENNREKHIISPNEGNGGFINSEIQPLVQLDHKNTIVINAAVGQGKSYAIIQTIKRYYKADEDYLIVVASPFVSLVTQYCNDIHKDAKIPNEDIYNYGNLGRRPDISYLDKKIHVVTVNTLLGNPGDEGFKSSDIKRQYINSLVNQCEKNDTKVVFIYDEIHDSYYNFKEEFIFNLWKWRNVICKNFILSATYNEASKVVIEYLAELTDKKIKIIESERVIIPKKQSDLYLHYSPAHNFTNETPEIVNLVESILDKGNKIDILCYSKKLAKTIIKDKTGVGSLLKEKFEEINDCTSELITNKRPKNEEPKNRFDNDKCNVGTNFKTGVSIKKEGHSFLIIMPPNSSKNDFRNWSGIFSGGINSIIQAIARQRLPEEIHIVLPKPNEFYYATLKSTSMSKKQLEVFSSWYDLVYYKQKKKKSVGYIPLGLQDKLIKKFYDREIKGNLNNEINYVNKLSRQDLTRLQFPSCNLFKLNHGEDFLANWFPFFGDDLSSFVTYSAFTNQFINCRLKGIVYKPIINFKKGDIHKSLFYYYKNYEIAEIFETQKSWGNFNLFYSELRNDLFGNFDLKYKKSDKSKWETITPYSLKFKEFEVKLISFSALIFFKDQRVNQLEKGVDIEFSRSEYFLNSVCVSNKLNNNFEEHDESTKYRIELYQIISHFREKLVNNVIDYSTARSKYSYLPASPSTNFYNSEDRQFFERLEELIVYDPFLENSVFEFKRRLTLNSLYTKLIEDFFEVMPDKLPTGRRMNIKKIISSKVLPSKKQCIDLLSQANYQEISPNNSFIEENYGSVENYLTIQEELNNLIENYIVELNTQP